jgi:hypothetical protein
MSVTLSERQAKALATWSRDYRARRIRGRWVVWCDASEHEVEFDLETVHGYPFFKQEEEKS